MKQTGSVGQGPETRKFKSQLRHEAHCVTSAKPNLTHRILYSHLFFLFAKLIPCFSALIRATMAANRLKTHIIKSNTFLKSIQAKQKKTLKRVKI